MALVACFSIVSNVRADTAMQPVVTTEAEPESSRPENGYWSEDSAPRFFLSTRSEFGVPYAKPYFSVGYGMPHWIWTGIDVNAIITGEFVQGYAGVRAATPILDFAFGYRDTLSFDKPFLAPGPHFTRNDVLDESGKRARYWAWEAEVVGIVPLPYSALVVDFITIHTLDVPEDRYVYDESYRAVVADPTFFVLRMAGVARFMNEESMRVGVLAEHVFGTARGKPLWRVGPAASLQLTDHLEVAMVLTLNVAGPDDLGLKLGAYGVAGIRYRWATGEKKPAWPWEDPIIPFM